MEQFMGRPGDRRNFVHKKIFKVATGIAGGFFSGGPLGAIRGGITAITGGRRDAPPCPSGFHMTTTGCVPLVTTGLPVAFPVAGRPTSFQDAGPGDAVMGQFGAALEPGIRSTATRVCPRGTVLGTDGLCYNRRDIKNSERWWPKGRAPLLTGGEMRCISIASRAANKLQRKQKQLIELGMLKPPARRSTQKRLAPGHHAHVQHD